MTWQLSIDTGGTFTDGLARDLAGNTHRVKVLSSSCLRGIIHDGKVVAPWLTAPIFDGYQAQIVETGQTATVVSLLVNGTLTTKPALQLFNSATIQLTTSEEAPVLAARLLTQTPLNQPFPVLEMRLGTTRGTNALLERRGGRVALLVTKGFKDLLLIGSQQRPNLFQLAIPPAEVLYETVLEVDERMTATGDVLQSLTPETIARLIADLQEIRPDAIAISFLNAYRNPVHEQKIANALVGAGCPVVTRSTEVSAAPGYVSRTQTAVVNAYLMPVLRQYLANVQAQLGGWPVQGHPVRDHPVRVMTSAGGLVRADLFRPKDSLLSGPAGGVIGAGHIAKKHGPALTLDMGGTSTDVARCDGEPDYRFSTRIGPFALQLPSLTIETVAAGGGSVCWFDAVAGQLRVGPQSAGATPGPACYGGGMPGQAGLLTITDVNLLLGRLLPRQFGIPVFADKAEAALNNLIRHIETVAGTAPNRTELLAGLIQIADEAMAGAIRAISVSRGLDPAQYSLLLFGGAGGLHGCSVANLLAISRLILPFDGGLLSAVGIGQARTERVASQPVLRLLADIAETLPDLVADLIAQTITELRQDIGPDTPVEVRSCWLAMRLAGQESTLDVVFQGSGIDALVADFQAHYQTIYGHYPETNNGQPRQVEVESIRVVVSTIEPDTYEKKGQVLAENQAVPLSESGPIPAYDWPTLKSGDTFTGPALLLNTTSSAFIEAGWTATVADDLTVIVLKIRATIPESVREQPTSQQSVIQTELFARRFMAVAEEMGAQLQRTAFSVNVKERLDFSCAVLDADGRLVANAPHIPVHLGSLGVCTRLVTSALSLGPGDVAITNHPGFGGSHLPDVTLIQAVFTDNGDRIGYVVNRAHHAEIGGKVPGSMPPDATNLTEEGVVLEPMYVVRNGRFLWESAPESPGIAVRFADAPYPTRALAENRADIEAAIASLRTGEVSLQTLARQHGPAVVRHYMNQLAQTATDALRRVLKPLDGQAFEAEELLDDGHRICVKIAVQAGRVTFDFRGTSAVHPRNLNANVSILNSAVLYVLRLWVDEDIPLNEGLMDPVSIVLPESSFLNPVFSDDPAHCPAVVGGNTEISQRLVDTLLKALNLGACSAGTMNNFLFGKSSATPESFGYYETIGGGAGATDGQAGRSGVHQHMTNTKLTDPEELERRYPVRLREFSLRPNSGGAGQWRGGDGLIRDIEFLEPVQVTLLSQHRVQAPYGSNGGQPGGVGQQFLVSEDGTQEPLPGIFTRAVLPGQRVRIETPGGGGFGAEQRG